MLSLPLVTWAIYYVDFKTNFSIPENNVTFLQDLQIEPFVQISLYMVTRNNARCGPIRHLS